MKAVCFLLAALNVAIAAPTDRCSDPMALVTCMSNINFQDMGEMFPTTEEDLDKRCSQYVTYMKCIRDYAEECPSAFPPHLKELMEDQYEVENGICTKGTELRRSFLKESKCINKNQILFHKCDYFISMRDKNGLTKEKCPEQKKSVECVDKGFKEKCGDSTLELFKKIGAPFRRYISKVCDA